MGAVPWHQAHHHASHQHLQVEGDGEGGGEHHDRAQTNTTAQLPVSLESQEGYVTQISDSAAHTDWWDILKRKLRK